MKRLTGSKKVFAVAGAILLVAAASSSALAMIDSGQTSAPKVQVQRPVKQNASGQAQQSPLPTPEPTSTPGSHGNEVEFRGTVEVIATTGWVIDGHTVQVTGDTLVEVGIDIGSVVKVHAQRQADGSLVASKIELVQNGGDDGNGNGNENENENENENHNGNVNSNDDGDDDHNGNGNVNSNDNGDDHGNDNGNVNSNDAGDDDHGGNSNDHHGGNDNEDHGGNDDHGGNGNGNDDHGGKGRG